MSIYFDFKTINELIGGDYYRQSKEFTLEELAKYDGSNGNPAYVAVEGNVYDLGKNDNCEGETHFCLVAGQDLTGKFNSCHEMTNFLRNAPRVGTLIDDQTNEGYNSFMYRQVKADTSKFTPDDWVRYISPLVSYALRENTAGVNTQNLYQRIIILGVLVGLGKTPQEAINQLVDWQNTGASQLLKSGTSTGVSTTGTGGTTTGVGTGTTGSKTTGFGTGTIGGGAGVGTGTTMGGGTGFGTGMGGSGMGSTTTGGGTGFGIGTIMGGSTGTNTTGGTGSTTTGSGTGGTTTGSSTGTSGSSTGVGSGTSGTTFNRLDLD